MTFVMIPRFLLLSLAAPAVAQFVANYDEGKVGTYSLPDPLVTQDGRRVTTARMWREVRRPEIVRLFESQVYGKSAPAPRSIEYEVVSSDATALGGKAIRRLVTIWPAAKKNAPQMHLLLYLPKNSKGRVPVFLGLNFTGNHTIDKDPGIPLAEVWSRGTRDTPPKKALAEESTRGVSIGRWPVEMILARGYAVATIYYGDIFPDHKDGLADSIIPHLYRAGQTAQAPDDWNAIGAWAYGLSRALDYLEKDRNVDARRVAVHGHSRLGKTSLWAGALDQRFALVISNDSGEGGAALARRNFGETVERINTAFPHWFNANFKKYNQDVAALPVDQHMLLALVAPRPLYVASAQDDQWADPRGEFLSAKAADPVYRLLGTDGFGAAEWPGVHQPVRTRIGYHIRAGKHDVTAYDWEQFLAFADMHLK